MMTIDKAIKVLRRKRRTEPGGSLGEEWDALNLGIEALKVVRRERVGDPPLDGELLPGETMDMPKSLTDPSIKLGQPRKEK